MSTPIVQVSLGGNPLSQVQARALSGQIEESDGEKADKLTLEISNYDGQLQEPTTGQNVAVAVGWVETGLVKVGNFIITSVSQRGAKAVFHVGGDSADLHKTLKGQKTRSWTTPKTLGDVFSQLAQDNGLSAAIDQTIAQIGIETCIAQILESDMHLMTRLARHYGALAKVQDGNLVVVPRGGGTTASGAAAASCVVDVTDCLDGFSFETNDRNQRQSSAAVHYDRSKAKRQTMTSTESGSETGPGFVFAHIFGGQNEAQKHADARKGKFDRNTRSCSLPLRPLLVGVPPGGTIQTTGFVGSANAIWVSKTRTFAWDHAGLLVRMTGEPKGQ